MQQNQSVDKRIAKENLENEPDDRSHDRKTLMGYVTVEPQKKASPSFLKAPGHTNNRTKIQKRLK